eukprot:2701007-Prymnesium_polylepis.1
MGAIKRKACRSPIEKLDPDTSSFAMCVPQYAGGCGGQDKADNPHEARKTGDTGAPIEDPEKP